MRANLLNIIRYSLIILPVCWISVADARDEDKEQPEWYGPQSGDVELRLAVDFTQLVQSELTDFELELGAGYFFTNWLEGGLSFSVGHNGTGLRYGGAPGNRPADVPDTPDLPDVPNPTIRTPNIPTIPARAGTPSFAVIQQGLTVSGLRDLRPGWQGGANLWIRWFPFELWGTDWLAEYFEPFVHLQFGPRFVADITPFLVGALSIGFNLYVTEQLALGPEIGYGLIVSLDPAVRFGADNMLDHALAAGWSVNVFF